MLRLPSFSISPTEKRQASRRHSGPGGTQGHGGGGRNRSVGEDETSSDET